MKKILNQILLANILCGVYVFSYAGLQTLNNEDLQQIEAQGGVDVSLILRLNQKSLQGQGGTGTTGFDSTTENYDYTTGSTYASVVTDPRESLDCENRQFCRFAAAFNNRVSNIDTDTGSDTTAGNKQWLVLKGLQGYIEIPKLSLEAGNVTDITKYSGEADAPTDRVALKIELSDADPLKIRHLGFEAASIEVGSSGSVGGNQFGYLNMNSCSVGTANCPVQGYLDGKYIDAGFDTGREVGFLGLDIHGNLAVNGKMYVFSCATRGAC